MDTVLIKSVGLFYPGNINYITTKQQESVLALLMLMCGVGVANQLAFCFSPVLVFMWCRVFSVKKKNLKCTDTFSF